ncbi:hypothetical protein F5B20DRAFT_594392 [Whalleya microplaca]|nr:hypothetical protein F5B20DRAFT_594392 [Whalleya microplaca]
MADPDPSSSPDPLVDEVPSSVRTFTRHMAKNRSHLDLSAYSIPHSNTSRNSSPSKQSPRKQTFELDVGDERSPQRILVTVEAEEAMKRGINRRLFPSSSPVRNARAKGATTTTTVPLNDGLEGDTPRKRGRPRRTSNGTPMPPRGKKRAGTPIQKSARRTRQKGDQGSEASMLSDAPMRTEEDSAKPKSRRKAGNTPKPTSTTSAVPSSQLSGKTTGRKRGRPRKALMPEEVAAVLTETGTRSGDSMLNTEISHPEDEISGNLPSLSNVSSGVARNQGYQGHIGSNDGVPTSDVPPNSTPTPAHRHIPHELESSPLNSGLPTASHHEEQSDGADYGMSDGFPAMEERHSDVESDVGDNGGMTHDGQYTLAHASDFSMIAVESLPSFQASFQASVNQVPSDHQEELGDETNLIINQTLESLRRSTQSDTARQSPSHLDVDRSTTRSSRLDAPDGLRGETGDNSRLLLSRSPRRPKPLPLNRKVFAGKAPHGDDLFSSIPDSVLRAATPGRLPMNPTISVEQRESTVYDDSFSEIPEELLEAVTPGRAPRTINPADEIATGDSALRNHINSANRGVASQLSSSRLPTPDDTSSSNAGSKRAHEDEIATSNEAQDVAAPFPHSDVRSSPPIINRPQDVGFGLSQLNQDVDGTPEVQQSSPQLPPSAKANSERSKSLEPPLPKIRPSLSPIVRVGRTLQNVMSDRPSPEREGSLGSPFRGSAGNEAPRPVSSGHSQQSSVARSPIQSNYNMAQHNHQSLLNPITALTQSTRSSFSRSQDAMENTVSGNARQPFAHGIHDHSQAESSGGPASTANNRALRPRNTANPLSGPSSIRVAPPSDDEMSWAEFGGDRRQGTTRESNSQQVRARSSSIDGTRGSDGSQAVSPVETGIQREIAEEPEEKIEEDDNGEVWDYEEDDGDIWDIEASRPSPEKAEPAQTAPESPVPPPRRSKIPSPWRRTSRRLIYQDEITSPSRIEIEESSQSEPEESFLARSMQRPLSSRQRAQKRLSEPFEIREESIVPLEQEAPVPQLGEQEEHTDVDEDEPVLPEPQSRAPLPSIQEESMEPAYVSEYSMVAEENPKEPAEVSEFSMVAQQMQDGPTTQKKPAPAKSRFFGGFDIMSFFSSPAALPKRAPDTKEVEEPRKAQQVAQPVLEQPLQKEPQQSLWATGLFPSIPQKEFRPSPERRVDLFSPAPVLRSTGTIPDTYASTSPSPSPAPSNSPSPAPSQSPSPSTPEQQTFQPIEQKRNFTPRPGQSGSNLFVPGPSGLSTGKSDTTVGLLQLPSEEQESSIMTDGTDYERVPPREKPSRWDRNLSPSKSCFRSPLKPTTPGRVVAFTNSTSSPLAQAQARAEQRNSNSNNILFQGPPLQPISEGTENNRSTSPASTTSGGSSSNSRASANTDTDTTAPTARFATTTTNNNNNKPTHTSTATTSVQPPRAAYPLSQTEWTKAHWVRMDEMLQLRRHSPLQFAQLCPLPPRHRRRSAAILGKEVTAQGERLVLEPWHLEVVEAFRLEVGGWDERNLAKRLFALLVGEERRRKGRVEKGRGRGKGGEKGRGREKGKERERAVVA